MPPRDWRIRISDMLSAIDRIERFASGMSEEQFCTDEKTIDAVVRNFTVIGEAAARVPSEVRTAYPDVPWDDMVAMRNFVVHEYFGVSIDVLWTTAKKDLPGLRPLLDGILHGK